MLKPIFEKTLDIDIFTNTQELKTVSKVLLKIKYLILLCHWNLLSSTQPRRQDLTFMFFSNFDS